MNFSFEIKKKSLYSALYSVVYSFYLYLYGKKI